MTERSDIAAGRLIYTCKCGWIDIGHATPKASKSSSSTRGADNLWRAVNGETGTRSPNGLWHQVTFSMYAYRFRSHWGPDDSVTAVRLGLTSDEKKAVALAIFLDMSMKFEAYQATK